MKKSLLCRLFISGATLFLSSMAVFPAYAAKISGRLDSVTESSIAGWARDKEASDAALNTILNISCQNPSIIVIYQVECDMLDQMQDV